MLRDQTFANREELDEVHLCCSQCPELEPFRDKTDLAGHMEIHENNFCQLSKQSFDSRKELDTLKKVHLSVQAAKQQTAKTTYQKISFEK